MKPKKNSMWINSFINSFQRFRRKR